MKFDHIYIISWFGKDPKLRSFRKKIHDKQLEWARINNLKITVLAQEYLPEDYHSDVEYLHSDEFLRPCGARNVLLEHFYRSGDDFAIFADNDTTIADKEPGKPNDLLANLRSLSLKDLENVDFISGLHPALQAFNEELKSPDYVENLVFKRTYKFNGGFFILKNIAKHYNKPLMFDDANFTIDNKIVPNEEGDFCINLLMNGFNCFQNCEAVFVDMAGATRSTWANTLAERSNKLWYINLINTKHNRQLFTMMEDQPRTYSHIGYGEGKSGKIKLKVRTDLKNLPKDGINEDGKFFALPQPMTVKDGVEWLAANVADPKMLELLEENKGKEFKRLTNPRSKFNWDNLTHDVPAKLLIPKPLVERAPKELTTFEKLFIID